MVFVEEVRRYLAIISLKDMSLDGWERHAALELHSKDASQPVAKRRRLIISVSDSGRSNEKFTSFSEA